MLLTTARSIVILASLVIFLVVVVPSGMGVLLIGSDIGRVFRLAVCLVKFDGGGRWMFIEMGVFVEMRVEDRTSVGGGMFFSFKLSFVHILTIINYPEVELFLLNPPPYLSPPISHIFNMCLTTPLRLFLLLL